MKLFLILFMFGAVAMAQNNQKLFDESVQFTVCQATCVLSNGDIHRNHNSRKIESIGNSLLETFENLLGQCKKGQIAQSSSVKYLELGGGGGYYSFVDRSTGVSHGYSVPVHPTAQVTMITSFKTATPSVCRQKTLNDMAIAKRLSRNYENVACGKLREDYSLYVEYRKQLMEKGKPDDLHLIGAFQAHLHNKCQTTQVSDDEIIGSR